MSNTYYGWCFGSDLRSSELTTIHLNHTKINLLRPVHMIPFHTAAPVTDCWVGQKLNFDWHCSPTHGTKGFMKGPRMFSCV